MFEGLPDPYDRSSTASSSRRLRILSPLLLLVVFSHVADSSRTVARLDASVPGPDRAASVSPAAASAAGALPVARRSPGRG